MPNLRGLFQSIIMIAMGHLLLSCNADSLLGQITVNNIVNPDQGPPVITFITTPSALTGDHDMTLEFTVEDDPEGQGISKAELFYAPDLDNPVWKSLGEVEKGTHTITFCVPNKNHPKPGFKVEASDLNGNDAVKILGADATNFSINLTSPAELAALLPGITSDSNGLTNLTSTDASITGTCQKTNCSATSIKYEDPSWNVFYAINVDSASAPASGDAAWTSCDDAVTNGLTLPDLTAVTAGDGAKTISLWIKAEDTDFDGFTALETITTSSADVSVTYDGTNPTVDITDLNAAISAGSNQNLTFTASDTNGIDNMT